MCHTALHKQANIEQLIVVARESCCKFARFAITSTVLTSHIVLDDSIVGRVSFHKISPIPVISCNEVSFAVILDGTEIIHFEFHV